MLQSEVYCLVVVGTTEPLPCCQDVQGKRIVLECLDDSIARSWRVLNSDAWTAERKLRKRSLMVQRETHGNIGTLLSVRTMNTCGPL